MDCFRARPKEKQADTADSQENTGKKIYLPRLLMWRAYQKS